MNSSIYPWPHGIQLKFTKWISWRHPPGGRSTARLASLQESTSITTRHHDIWWPHLVHEYHFFERGLYVPVPDNYTVLNILNLPCLLPLQFGLPGRLESPSACWLALWWGLLMDFCPPPPPRSPPPHNLSSFNCSYSLAFFHYGYLLPLSLPLHWVHPIKNSSLVLHTPIAHVAAQCVPLASTSSALTSTSGTSRRLPYLGLLTGFRIHFTLKSQLILVDVLFLAQWGLNGSRFSLVFPTYVQFCSPIVVLYFL